MERLVKLKESTLNLLPSTPPASIHGGNEFIERKNKNSTPSANDDDDNNKVDEAESILIKYLPPVDYNSSRTELAARIRRNETTDIANLGAIKNNLLFRNGKLREKTKAVYASLDKYYDFLVAPSLLASLSRLLTIDDLVALFRYLILTLKKSPSYSVKIVLRVYSRLKREKRFQELDEQGNKISLNVSNVLSNIYYERKLYERVDPSSSERERFETLNPPAGKGDEDEHQRRLDSTFYTSNDNAQVFLNCVVRDILGLVSSSSLVITPPAMAKDRNPLTAASALPTFYAIDSDVFTFSSFSNKQLRRQFEMYLIWLLAIGTGARVVRELLTMNSYELNRFVDTGSHKMFSKNGRIELLLFEEMRQFLRPLVKEYTSFWGSLSQNEKRILREQCKRKTSDGSMRTSNPLDSTADPIFTISEDSLRDRFASYVRANVSKKLIKGLSLHWFRCWYIQTIKMSHNLRTAQKAVSHSRSSTTRRYCRRGKPPPPKLSGRSLNCAFLSSLVANGDLQNSSGR